MKDPYFIGLDGGGTRTVAILTDAEGRILAFQRGDSTNYHVVGEPKAQENMVHILESLLVQAQISKERLGKVCLGLSGCDRPDDRALVNHWMVQFGIADRTRIVNDAVIALAGGTLSDAGLLVISGTGSIFFARGVNGKTRRVGGWGPLLADEGSGYHLGREALRAIMRSYDGYEPPTQLTSSILQTLGFENPPQLVRWSTTEGLIKDKVATLSRHVFTAAESGDPAATGILKRLSKLVANRVSILAGLIDLGSSYEIVLAGGNFKHADIYFELAKAEIQALLPNVQVIRPKMQPVAGAILFAMADSGQKVNEKVIEQLGSTYPEKP